MDRFDLHLDYYGLLSLHKALLEARFHEDPENGMVAGSPLVADIHVQVRDLLIKSDKGSQWLEWFQLGNRPDRKDRAIMLIRKCKRWNKSPLDEKEKIAAVYLSPFLYSKTELDEVIAELDGSEIAPEGKENG